MATKRGPEITEHNIHAMRDTKRRRRKHNRDTNAHDTQPPASHVEVQPHPKPFHCKVDLPGAALIDTKDLYIVATIRWDTQSFDPSIYVVVDPSKRLRCAKNLVEDPDRSYLWLEDPIFLGSSEAEAQRLAVSGLRRALRCLARVHKT